MKIRFLLPVCFLFTFASAQKNHEYSFMLRKGLDTKDDKDKHAVFSMTWPQDGKPKSFLLNAAAGGTYSRINKNSRVDITPSFGYNRNTQIKKEQFNFKTNLGGQLQLSKESTNEKDHTYYIFNLNAQHMWNRIDTSRSQFLTFYFWYVYKRDKQLFGLNEYKNFGKSGVLYYLGPSIGLEYQNRYSVKAPAQKGQITRFFWGADLRLQFKGGNPGNQSIGNKKRAEITFNYASRHELSSTLAVKEGTTHLTKAEFNVFPFGAETVAIGLSYNEGQDPIAALERQHFWQLALKLKLDFPPK